jgi:hypothetical protein
VQPKGTLPFDVVHPVGDYTFRRVPSDSKPADLEIHQLKYPTFGAHRDLNVIFPIERLQEATGTTPGAYRQSLSASLIVVPEAFARKSDMLDASHEEAFARFPRRA